MGRKKPRVKAVHTVEKKKLEVLNAHCTNCKGNLPLVAMIQDVPKPRLFIHDGHILCFPTHTSHALQPVNVDFFKTVKATWSDILRKFFKKNKSESITKKQFASLLDTWWKK